MPIGQDEPLFAALAALRRGRVAHAQLISGAEGAGKGLFAETVARAQFCSSPDEAGMPCGQCTPCRMVLAGTHPDLHWTDAVGKLGIEESRALGRATLLAPHSASCSIFVVEACERLTGPAAGALLKTLEDPVGPVLFLLLAEHPDQMEPTLRSRCLPLRLRPVSPAVIETWLMELRPDLARERLPALARRSRGLPGLALKLADAGGPTCGEEVREVARALALESTGRAAMVAAGLAARGSSPERALELLRDAWLQQQGWSADVAPLSDGEVPDLEPLARAWSAPMLARAGMVCVAAAEAAETNVNPSLNWHVLLGRLRRLCASC